MIAGYLRVSTCKQHLTNQKEEIQRYAAARNFCVATWVTEIVNGVILGWAGTDEAEEAKKKPAEGTPRGLYGAAATYSPTRVRAVPSAQARLTSLFGMGRGWSTPL